MSNPHLYLCWNPAARRDVRGYRKRQEERPSRARVAGLAVRSRVGWLRGIGSIESGHFYHNCDRHVRQGAEKHYNRIGITVNPGKIAG